MSLYFVETEKRFVRSCYYDRYNYYQPKNIDDINNMFEENIMYLYPFMTMSRADNLIKNRVWV